MIVFHIVFNTPFFFNFSELISVVQNTVIKDIIASKDFIFYQYDYTRELFLLMLSKLRARKCDWLLFSTNNHSIHGNPIFQLFQYSVLSEDLTSQQAFILQALHVSAQTSFPHKHNHFENMN